MGRRLPESAEAAEVLAVSLELLRDPVAIAEIQRARSLATSADERFRIAAVEVWTRLKFSIPDDIAGTRRARLLADSLIARPPAGASNSRFVLNLAVLTGRAFLAARYARDPVVAEGWRVPAVLARTAPPLLVFASLGGPADSINALEAQMVRGLATMIPRERRNATGSWLVQSATLAFPDHRFASLESLVDRLAATQTAFLRDEIHTVRDSLAAVAARRLGRPAHELTFDALYPEAALLKELGDLSQAVDWIDPSLNDLVSTAPQMFADPARVGGLLRAMILRARIARESGDLGTARRWARVVVELWRNAEDFLQPTVREMHELAALR